MVGHILEICCDSVDSATHAEQGGADRIELCEKLDQGGVTPSAGKVKRVKCAVNIPVHVLVRPRKGDFVYNDNEFQVMLDDILFLKQLGVDGIVSGILKENGEVDIEKTKKLLEISSPMDFTFHRAIDVSSNLLKSIETLDEIGVPRVLTSGAASCALEGYNSLQKILETKRNIKLLIGGGIRPNNISHFFKLSDFEGFHSSASIAVQRNHCREGIPMGSGSESAEHIHKVVSRDSVHEMKSLLINYRNTL